MRSLLKGRKKMVKKRQTVSSLKNKIVPVFSKYVRLRDCLLTTGSIEYGECISCGNQFEYKDLDAGHFIPKHNANLFSERGVNAQCRYCNSFKHGNQFEYSLGLIERYGKDAPMELRAEARQYKKFTVPELEQMLVEFKSKIRELEERC